MEAFDIWNKTPIIQSAYDRTATRLRKEGWKAALEWVLDMSDDRIDRDMLNEELGRELEN